MGGSSSAETDRIGSVKFQCPERVRAFPSTSQVEGLGRVRPAAIGLAVGRKRCPIQFADDAEAMQVSGKPLPPRLAVGIRWTGQVGMQVTGFGSCRLRGRLPDCRATSLSSVGVGLRPRILLAPNPQSDTRSLSTVSWLNPCCLQLENRGIQPFLRSPSGLDPPANFAVFQKNRWQRSQSEKP